MAGVYYEKSRVKLMWVLYFSLQKAYTLYIVIVVKLNNIKRTLSRIILSITRPENRTSVPIHSAKVAIRMAMEWLEDRLPLVLISDNKQI